MFEPKRDFAHKKLISFIDNNLIEYSKLRNFDFGPDQRRNISCLSPYITHGVLSEIEVMNLSLKKFPFVKIEKFIQEVLWRVYWKGWLELRPSVWSDYIINLQAIREKYKEDPKYLEAIEGKTNIECFNEWVGELKTYNYLHNHTRMWFASIWIFTLNLPWQLGAEFFLKHLYDGDAASNTLGWRWVAGIQTQGKHYLASEWNIKKFTNNRFQNIKLNENAPPKISEKTYSIAKKDFVNPEINNDKTLVIFENNLSFEMLDLKKFQFKKIILASNIDELRQIKLSDNVTKFKTNLLHDQLERIKTLSIDCEILTIDKLKDVKDDYYILYPNVGENLDYILSKLSGYKFLYRELDQFSWGFCNKGFFNFKGYIPKIITKFT
tara:strand:+ start:291 stop:1430 length:1140 start_codon:yes stop_codon:yes gene_type:complete